VPLGELVVERRERAITYGAVVLDTTHAREGLIDIHAALRAVPSAKSAKKGARPGELLVSRLRPYLRQIAYVHPKVLEATSDRPLALSTEFYVLAPRGGQEDLAFLVPFLLGPQAQGVLSAAQEGGHHPRVPLESLLALRVPNELVKDREPRSREVRALLSALYVASARFQGLLAR
jgi:hypothetical protein